MTAKKYEHEKGWKEYFTNANFSNIAWFFVGGIAGTSFLELLVQKFFHVRRPFLLSAAITFGLICLKELADQISSIILPLRGRWGLDPAGADWRDILLGFVGCGFVILILNF